MRLTHAPAWVLLLTAALWPAAAAPGGEEGAAVQGVITLDGVPLAAGRVTFHAEDGQLAGCKVKDGMYRVDRLPAGRLAVTVEAPGVPARYASPEHTDLMAVPKAGPNAFDIALKSR